MDDRVAPKEKEEEEKELCSSLPVEEIYSNKDNLPTSEKTENVPKNPNPPESMLPHVKQHLI
jgi:hypothetical protein